MPNIKVGRYSDPSRNGGWAGWLEPEDRSWIMFVDVHGTPLVCLDRDPATGAVRSGGHREVPGYEVPASG